MKKGDFQAREQIFRKGTSTFEAGAPPVKPKQNVLTVPVRRYEI
jgi:hypothetical protein